MKLQMVCVVAMAFSLGTAALAAEKQRCEKCEQEKARRHFLETKKVDSSTAGAKSSPTGAAKAQTGR